LVPAFDGGDDFVRVRGPCEGLWRLVCFGEVSIDGFLEIDDGSEDATLMTVPLHVAADDGSVEHFKC
jgi:hypothetical protein